MLSAPDRSPLACPLIHIERGGNEERIVTPADMLKWLNEGPLVQVGPKSVHENQLVWNQDPTLTMSDGSTIKFDDWVMQGPMVTDGTSWMTENQFVWNHRNDASQGPWFRQSDGSMIQLGQWLQQGPMVQDGSTWVHENQFLWNHQGEQWIFEPDPKDPTHTRGTMVPLDQWLKQGPMVTAPDGTKMTWNQFVYDHQADFTPNASDPWEVTPDGHVMRRSVFMHWGPQVTGPDGKTMPQGQFMLDHPDDPHNPWIYLPYNPGDPNSYLDPQWLKSGAASVSVSVPLTATTLSDYAGKTAFDIDSMTGLRDDLYQKHVTAVDDILNRLLSDMQGIEVAIGDKAYQGMLEPQPIPPSLQGIHPFGPPIPLPSTSREVQMAQSMQANWAQGWSALTEINIDRPSHFLQVAEAMTSMAKTLGFAAELAWQAEKSTVDSIRAAGFDVNVTMPDEPEPKQRNRGPVI